MGMDTYKLKKGDLDSFLKKLGEEFKVYTPVESDGIVAFEELTPEKGARLDYARTHKPPKYVFYSQTEVMFSYDKDGMHPVKYKGKPIALFGVRPCDAKSFVLLERVFIDTEYEDPYWAARRKDSLIISFACNDPLPSCFCNWLGGGPFGNTGSDISVTDIGEAYLFEPISSNGERFLQVVDVLKEATEKDIEKARKAKERAESSMGKPQQLDSLKESLDERWDDPLWEEFSSICLGCATCTYLCPTCHCFDILDESRHGKGIRVRLWDSCMFPLFTKEGSGHNPRPTQKHRLRQRFMHKFSYFVEKQGDFGCVGCGRCVSFCPVNIDIRSFIIRASKLHKGGRVNKPQSVSDGAQS